jgi:phage gp46-like protein
MIDLMIYETGSGGDLNLKNDDLDTISGLTNQVYLAFFGGNKEQSTSDELNELEQRKDWWGNFLMEPENQFNSELERTLDNVAINTEGISKIENAAKNDLQYLDEYADIEIEAFILSVAKVQIDVSLTEPNNNSTKLKFIWDGTKNELIEEIVI